MVKQVLNLMCSDKKKRQIPTTRTDEEFEVHEV